MSIADMWTAIGGTREIEIGALEPLLWRDHRYQIHDLVRALSDRGFIVSMTTNGQLLDSFAVDLSKAGLSLIRTSWHSTDPRVFREISGGYGDYKRFIRGVTLALESNIKIAFNRVLLNGFTDDIPEQLTFIEQFKSRLKLYTLLWTPQNAGTYQSSYLDWRDVVRAHVLPRTSKTVRVKKDLGRRRLRFELAQGGLVEVKLGDSLDRSMPPCQSCPFTKECEERFGDYVRIDPRMSLYFCYMRRDIGLPIAELLDKPDALRNRLNAQLQYVEADALIRTAPLRLTVTPYCNFNCRTPGAKKGWCMEQPGEFIYPKIRPSLL